MGQADQGSMVEVLADEDYTAVLGSVLNQAAQAGASSAEVGASVHCGLSVTVRKGEVETLEFNRDKGIGITVYFGQCKGAANTTDTRPEAIRATVQAACDRARFTEGDPCHGLADADLMATEFPDLDLCYPSTQTPEQAIEAARALEAMGLAHDTRISNSEGANIHRVHTMGWYANSHGFMQTVESTRYSTSCTLIAGQGDAMQRDYWYTVARDSADLDAAEEVAKKAAERTIRRLDARSLPTQKAPVIFSADIASSLIGHFISAISGGNLYRKSSFLLDCLDKPVFSSHLRLHERPYLKKGLGSAAFDSEGVQTQARDIVSDGVLRGYVLSSYSARRLGLKTTANAGGVHNLTLESKATQTGGLATLLKKMDTGLLVTGLMGQGINIVTGDYSRGAHGFWVEKGVIQYPVQEITIAGNLRDMLHGIVAVGDDIDKRGNTLTGSMLLEEMTIAGQS